MLPSTNVPYLQWVNPELASESRWQPGALPLMPVAYRKLTSNACEDFFKLRGIEPNSPLRDGGEQVCVTHFTVWGRRH